MTIEKKDVHYVGQVIFVVLNKVRRIIPMLIVEEVTKKTLHGIDKIHIAQVGQTKETMVVSEIEGIVYDSAENAKIALVSQAQRSIIKQIDQATAQAAAWYPENYVVGSQHQEETEPTDVDEIVQSVEDEPVMVELPDGTMARLRTQTLRVT